jgi:uncharacterized protein (DUF1501 family)
MLTFNSNKSVRFCDGLSRRDFLRVGSLAAGSMGLSLADLTQAAGSGRSGDVNCILLFLVGGPSQLDTWDPKPNAPDNVRGPFRPIQTSVPGVQISENFPLMARMAQRYAILRSVNHQAAPIHETGHQLMQTGHLFRSNQEYPHYGAVVSKLRGPRHNGVPPFVVLPSPITTTGVNVSHGQGAGPLGQPHDPFLLQGKMTTEGFRLANINTPAGLDPARLTNRTQLLDTIDNAQRAFDASLAVRAPDHATGQAYNLVFGQNTRRAFDLASEPEDLRTRYGRNTFGQSCLLARRMIEHGVRLATVNMFDTVFNEITWDCHADGGSLAVNLNDYRETLCPTFDRAYSTLLDDLHQRGLLANTLVVAMGEFGRTPQLNARGGRDHWPGVWSVLFAGAGVRGGQTIGTSDRIAAEPHQRPISPQEVAASVYHALAINPQNLVEATPIHELFS